MPPLVVMPRYTSLEWMLHQELINSMDAFIFPKSIGDINNSDPNGLEKLSCLDFKQSEEKYISPKLICNKKIIPNRSDLKIFLSVVHAALIQQGFQCKDSPNTTFSLLELQPHAD